MAVPINDEIQNAIRITANGNPTSPSFSENTVGATFSSGEPSVAATGATVWYVYTPQTSGLTTFTTDGSDFDTTLGIYQRTNAGQPLTYANLTSRGANDDDGTGGNFPGGRGENSSVTINVVAGQDYYIQLGGFVGSTGNAKLSVEGQAPAPACYVTGTLIRTTRGQVPVEDLVVGDLAVTASGAHRPIRWIGHHSLDLRQCPDQAAVQPFKITKDAFAPGRPERDLFVSPGHPICVDVLGEVLIPAFCLANGSTVQQVERDSVTYWHVELDSHDILLAEGLPAESYLESDDRSFFGKNGQSPALGSATSGRCRPFARDGALVELVRERLSERAELLGWQKSSDMDIHLTIDGVRVEPTCADGLVRFLVPQDARDVCLMSAWYQPSWGRAPDNRHLGIAVSGIRLSDGLLFDREIIPADERLTDGFYPVETHEEWSWRWTNGFARLPSELWAEAKGDVFLTVAFNSAASQRWIEPAASCQVEEFEAPGNVIRLRA